MAKKAAKKAARKGRAAPKPAAAAAPRRDVPPDQLPVTERRAKHLAEIARVDVKKIAGRKISEVHELLKWKIDPKLLLEDPWRSLYYQHTQPPAFNAYLAAVLRSARTRRGR